MVLRLLFELYIAGIMIFTQYTVYDCCTDRAAGFLPVATVRIATIQGKLDDVFKALVNPFAYTKKAYLSHSRCINQHGALIKNNKLAARSGMCAFSRSTHGLCVKSILPD